MVLEDGVSDARTTVILQQVELYLASSPRKAM